MKTFLLICAVSLGLTACSGDGDHNGPVASAPTVFCKSPVTDSFVPKEVAVTEARKILAQRKSLNLGDTANNTVSVDCGDDVVFVTPVIITE